MKLRWAHTCIHLQKIIFKAKRWKQTRPAETSGWKLINPKMNLILVLAAAAQPELGLTLILLFLIERTNSCKINLSSD